MVSFVYLDSCHQSRMQTFVALYTLAWAMQAFVAEKQGRIKVARKADEVEHRYADADALGDLQRRVRFNSSHMMSLDLLCARVKVPVLQVAALPRLDDSDQKKLSAAVRFPDAPTVQQRLTLPTSCV
jgi:hypothetical protein